MDLWSQRGVGWLVFSSFFNPLQFHLYFWDWLIDKKGFIKQKREVRILILQVWVYSGMQQDRFITEASIVLESLIYTS